MKQSELDKILKDHKDWLNNNNTGKQANLSGANLRYADLIGADLEDANLIYANLKGANLYRANLSYADLRWANLTRANLIDANLRDADLRWAYLEDAILEQANLTDANLKGANLEYVHIIKYSISDVHGVSSLITELCSGEKIPLRSNIQLAIDNHKICKNKFWANSPHEIISIVTMQNK